MAPDPPFPNMTEKKPPLFSASITTHCSCSAELCAHQQDALLKVIEDAWQTGRKAGIATVIEKIRVASASGLALRLQDGELEEPDDGNNPGQSSN